jgi:hypothetical protein
VDLFHVSDGTRGFSFLKIAPLRPTKCRDDIHMRLFLIYKASNVKITKIILLSAVSIYGSTVLLLDLGRFFSFLIYTHSVGLLGRGIRPSQGSCLTQNKTTKTSIPWVGSEPTIPTFEQAKTVHASDSATTVIGTSFCYMMQISYITLPPCQNKCFRVE